jgi:NAD+ diphosphatase
MGKNRQTEEKEMIQDIFPHKMHNEFHTDARPKETDIVFAFENGKLWMKEQETAEDAFFRVGDLAGWQDLPLTYLFSIDEQAFFLWTTEVVEGAKLVDIRKLREQNRISREMAFAVYTAKHLADWYRDNRFCGRCGKGMEHSVTERAMTCKGCGYTSYPRIMPAVIVGVVKGDELLITKYRTGYRHNALIAGFTEIGETLEETVQREVMEETGIRVKNIRYYKSQPWGIANDILVGFYCEADGDSCIHMDENELSYAEWIRREDIVLQPDDYSLTNEMMSKFKNNEV